MQKQLIQIPTENEARPSFLSPTIVLIILGGIFGVLFIFSIDPFFYMVERLVHKSAFIGAWHPQDHDKVQDYSVACLYAVFFGVCIILTPINYKDKYMLVWAWAIKCFVALFVMLFYEAHYASDALGYWRPFISYESKYGMKTIFELLNRKGQLRLVFVHDILFLVTPKFLMYSYHSLKISHTMIGLIATYIFYRTSFLITKKGNQMFFWIILLWPTLLLYTSRVGKETVVLLGIAIFANGVVNWHYKRKFIHLCLVALGIALVTYFRPWMGLILLTPLLIYFLIASKTIFFRATIALFIIFVFIPNADWALEKAGVSSAYGQSTTQRVFKRIETIVNNYKTVPGSQQLGRSAINRHSLIKFKGPIDVIKYAPEGIFTALFRPLPLDVPGLIGFLSGFEGLILLYLTFRTIKKTSMQEFKNPIFFWAITTVLFWALAYGFAIQNFGTGIRWKTQIVPIFLALLLYLGYRDRENIHDKPSKP